LRVGIQDIHNIDTKGRWWIVGAAWTGRDPNEALPSESSKHDEKDNQLLKIAKSQKMNTDLRRSIFVVLMTSEDYIDAYERLLKLGLKDKQEREMVRVLLHCCAQEKAFNPYYALISQRLCEYQYSFKITFQYALWDILKACTDEDLEEYAGKEGIKKISNIAKLFLHLITTKSVPLTILKTLEFMSLSDLQLLFCKIVLGGIFNGHNLNSKIEKEFKDIFGRAKEAKDNFKEGLLLFIQQYMLPTAGKIPGVLDLPKETFKERIKLVKNHLMN
jgi:nucleolar MIF4G domain-containing protein 1